MEDHRPTRSLKRAELIGASSPATSKLPRLAFVPEESFELRSEEREGGSPLLLPPSSDSSEKISVPSSGEIVSSNFASSSSSSSSSSPFELPRSSERCGEESVDIVEKFDIVGVDPQQQAKSFETEASTCNSDFSGETTPSSEAAAKSATIKPSPANPTAVASGRRPPAADMPSRAELESFFSAAEEPEQQRFADKYNYDVVMDAPREGRYEWIRLKP